MVTQIRFDGRTMVLFLDLLGLTVAVSGDTVMVSAPQQINLQGAVYIFR